MTKSTQKYLQARLDQFKNLVQLSKEEGISLKDTLIKAGYTLSFRGETLKASKGRSIISYSDGICKAMITPLT